MGQIKDKPNLGPWTIRLVIETVAAIAVVMFLGGILGLGFGLMMKAIAPDLIR